MPELTALPTDELLARARAVRDQRWGTRVTYSPKVFIPLTMLCRDRCGYCTFAQPPARLDQPYLDPEQVLAIARSGARAGCHEALFTLGERPELRYPAAREWLDRRGYDSTVAYLEAMCALVLAETGLLPHANAGALHPDELARLRAVSPSQGMMLETLRADLDAHRGSPDKAPERRLATLEAAGELGIAFTTGILVGIGEDEADRVVALEAIAASHRRHGHVQEVIVQNFLPKEGTAMWRHAPCPDEAYRRAIALARLILPPEVHLQAPPNLSDDPGTLLDAGIDDWGGVSPVTADHVNPERPWPALDRLRAVTEDRGHTLAPRLTIHPEHACQPDRWLDPALHFAVMDRSDAEGLGRDDPGAHFPEKAEFVRQGDTGADVVLIGDRSTAWYSGAPARPPRLVPGTAAHAGPVAEVLAGVRGGQTPGFDELLTLFRARGPEVAAVAALADELRVEAVGDAVTYVQNRNINYTNVCTFKCRFCGFSKGPLSLNLRGKPYLLTLDDIAGRVREAAELGATEVCLQGGIHPDFDGDYYLDVTRAVKDAAPDIHVHGFTALEVIEGARRLGEPLADYLRRMMDAGLRSLPGTAAEILDDPVRQVLCPDKITTDEWLDAHRTAHEIGLRSNVTMMFGAVEHPESWVRHLLATRDLQLRTGGFTEFVGLPFVHMASPIYLQRKARRGPTFRETLLVHAVARIAYRGVIDNVQASWVKIGVDGVRQLLQAGCNDLGGTLMDENISRAAGAAHGQHLTAADFADLVEPLGRRLEQRTTLYGDAEVDRLVTAVLALVGVDRDDDLVRQLIVTALQMDVDETDRAELKIASQALAEMHHTWKVFAPYRDRSKVMVFGSARTVPGQPDYELARTFGRLAAEAGWMVITGAGPGVMAAAMEGAGVDNSMGVNIVLPFEQRSNPVIAGDPKLATVRYFFTRKLAFVKESDAFVLLPGGFGTLDETFELITLMQTGKTYPTPIVLLDHPASTYWDSWRRFVADELHRGGLVGDPDLDLYHHTRDPADAVAFVSRFYAVYHSLRYVGPLLVLRLHRPVDEHVVRTLEAEFGDVIVDGGIEVVGPSRAEQRDDDVVGLFRLALRFDHRSYGRLHQLIRRLNQLGAPAGPPPITGGLLHGVDPEPEVDPLAPAS